MEAATLGIFMISVCLAGVLLAYPGSPVSSLLPGPVQRRVAAGIAMGLTMVGVACSPWGRRSGAHLNPALTLAFLTLGKIAPWDAIFYVAAQFAGGAAGVLVSRRLSGTALSDPWVNYVVTTPGPEGPWTAFAAEFAISLLFAFLVLRSSNSRRWSRHTPIVAGCLVAMFMSLESPVSGMSMNPARTFASALPSGVWTDFWVYLFAPPLAMIAAAQLYRHSKGARRVFCAKLQHDHTEPCIFHCHYGALLE